MRFKDYKPEDLVGKLVVVVNDDKHTIREITAVTETSFRVESCLGAFDLETGEQRLLKRKNKARHARVYARLLTGKDEAELNEARKQVDRRGHLIWAIRKQVPELETPVLEQILTIISS